MKKSLYLIIVAMILVSCTTAETKAENSNGGYDFWDDAFDFAEIKESERDGMWIGGLARSYHNPVFAIEVNRWVFSDEQSFSESISDIRKGDSSIYICWNHSCDEPARCSHKKCSGYIAKTFGKNNNCAAHIWHEKQGLYFLIKIDNHIKQCSEAFNRVKTNQYQVSIWRKCYRGKTIYDDTAQRYLRLCRDGEITEISLTKTPKDKTTWVKSVRYA